MKSPNLLGDAPSAPPIDLMNEPPSYEESQRHRYGWNIEATEPKNENNPAPELPPGPNLNKNIENEPKKRFSFGTICFWTFYLLVCLKIFWLIQESFFGIAFRDFAYINFGALYRSSQSHYFRKICVTAGYLVSLYEVFERIQDNEFTEAFEHFGCITIVAIYLSSQKIKFRTICFWIFYFSCCMDVFREIQAAEFTKAVIYFGNVALCVRHRHLFSTMSFWESFFYCCFLTLWQLYFGGLQSAVECFVVSNICAFVLYRSAVECFVVFNICAFELYRLNIFGDEEGDEEAPENTLRHLIADSSKYIGKNHKMFTFPERSLKTGDKVTFYTSIMNDYSRVVGGWSFNFFDGNYRNVFNYNPRPGHLAVTVTACTSHWGVWSGRNLHVPDQTFPANPLNCYKSGLKQKTVIEITKDTIQVNVDKCLVGEIQFTFLKEINNDFDPEKGLVHMSFNNVILDGLSITSGWMTTEIPDYSEDQEKNFPIPW